MYEIKRAWKNSSDGIIHHQIGEYTLSYRGVKAGLAWPQGGAPGYYCILGQQNQENSQKKYPLVLLAEGESKNTQRLFHKLTDDMKMAICANIYSNLGPEWEGYAKSFNKHCSDTDTRGVYIQQAPHTENFQFGLSLISQLLEKFALEVDRDAIVRDQLGSIPDRDLGETLEEVYYAVSALRFVVAAFEEYGGPGHGPEYYQRLYDQYGPPRL